MTNITKTELIERLKNATRFSIRYAKFNHYATFFLTLLGALSSATATIIVALGKGVDLKTFTAVSAAIPAAAMLLLSSLKLQDRSRWHWTKTKRLESLERGLSYEGRTVEDIGKAWSEMEEEFDRARVGFGPVSNK